MRWVATLAVASLLAGCGDGRTAARGEAGPRGGASAAAARGEAGPRGGASAAAARAEAAPVGAAGAAPAAAARADAARWSRAVAAPHAPLPCPASSSRANWPARALALPDGTFAALTGVTPSLASVDAAGRVLSGTGIGAQGDVGVRLLACAADGRLVMAWVEQRDQVFSLVVRFRAPDGMLPAQTYVDAVTSQTDEPGIGAVAVAFAPDGELLLAYATQTELRALTFSPQRARGETVTLGRVMAITDVEAEIAATGRAVVAWSTIDGGIERNHPRRVYAATRSRGALFGRARLLDRARGTDPFDVVDEPLRVAVAPDGRALVLYGLDERHNRHRVRAIEAPPERGFGTPRTLAPAGEPGDVALRADGTALAVWRGHGRLRAALHGPGERFGTPEVVVGGSYTDEHTAAFGADGRARVGWRRFETKRTAFSVRE